MDPILKGICKFTKSLISLELEEAVCGSDTAIFSEDNLTPSTPSYQKQTSKMALPDYTVYIYFISALATRKAPVILIMEKKEFNDDSIVQAIGCYIASKESVHGSYIAEASSGSRAR